VRERGFKNAGILRCGALEKRERHHLRECFAMRIVIMLNVANYKTLVFFPNTWPLLWFGLRWWKRACNDFRLKAGNLMCTVAKRFIVAQAATTEGDCRPSAKIELVAVLIEQLEVTFETNASVILNRDSRGHNSALLPTS